MTKPSVALEAHREDIRRIVAANHAARPRIFGSVVHGDDTDASDLDLLVEAIPGTPLTYFDLGGIERELTALLGVPVDVLTPNALPLSFRDEVLAEAISV